MFPMWLSVPKRVSMSKLVSCAHEVSGSAMKAAAPNQSDHFPNFVRMSIPRIDRSLEIEVKSHQQFAGIYVRGVQAESWARTVLVQPVVLVVPRQAGPAGHERVVAEADGVRRDVAEVG